MKVAREDFLHELNALDMTVQPTIIQPVPPNTLSSSSESRDSFLSTMPIPSSSYMTLNTLTLILLQHMILIWWSKCFMRISKLRIYPGKTTTLLQPVASPSSNATYVLSICSWKEIGHPSGASRGYFPYDMLLYLAITINDQYDIFMYSLLGMTDMEKCLGNARPRCVSHSLIGNPGKGTTGFRHGSTSVSSDLNDFVLKTVCASSLWASRHRLHEVAKQLREFSKSTEAGANQFTESGAVSALLLSSGDLIPEANSSDEPPAENTKRSIVHREVVVCNCTLSSVTMVLRPHVNLTGRDKEWRKVPAPSDLALRIPWVAVATWLIIDLIDDNVVIQVVAKQGVVPVSHALRVMAEVSRHWVTIRDTLRQLLSRCEINWLSPLGSNFIKVQGLHISVSFYISSETSPRVVSSTGEPLSLGTDDRDQQLAAEYLGQAHISLSCLDVCDSMECSRDSVHDMSEDNENSCADNDDFPDDEMSFRCLDFRCVGSAAEGDWEVSVQGLYFIEFARSFFNVCLNSYNRHIDHARRALHYSIASFRPFLEFAWRLCRCRSLPGVTGARDGQDINLFPSSNTSTESTEVVACNVTIRCIRIWSSQCVTFSISWQYGGASRSFLFDASCSGMCDIMILIARRPIEWRREVLLIELRKTDVALDLLRDLIWSVTKTFASVTK